MLATIRGPGFPMDDAWAAQIVALILMRARVGLFSEIPADDVRAAHIEPVADLRQRLLDELARRGAETPVAILPEGPMTIPYLAPPQ